MGAEVSRRLIYCKQSWGHQFFGALISIATSILILVLVAQHYLGQLHLT